MHGDHLDNFDLFLQADMKQELILLLGKLHYAMGDYSKALSQYEEANLDSLSLSNISVRKLKIIGEAFAIKGPYLSGIHAVVKWYIKEICYR